jgi:hypothetical protein
MTPVAFDCDGNGAVDLMMLDSEGYLSWHLRRASRGSVGAWFAAPAISWTRKESR